MRLLLTGSMLCLLSVATTLAQGDPFNGTWKLNLAKSQQTALQAETLIYKVVGGEEDYTADITPSTGPPRKEHYVAKYNDGKWHPVHDVLTGKTTGSVMMVRIDSKSEIRIGRGADDTLGTTMLRVLSADGKGYTSTLIGRDGKITSVLFFDKQ